MSHRTFCCLKKVQIEVEWQCYYYFLDTHLYICVLNVCKCVHISSVIMWYSTSGFLEKIQKIMLNSIHLSKLFWKTVFWRNITIPVFQGRKIKYLELIISTFLYNNYKFSHLIYLYKKGTLFYYVRSIPYTSSGAILYVGLISSISVKVPDVDVE